MDFAMVDRLITLEISEEPADGGRRFIYNLWIDEQIIKTTQVLSLKDSNNLLNMGEAYYALFAEQAVPAQLALDHIRAMGSQLFELWLKPNWEILGASRSVERQVLVIASKQANVLNLPWELLRVPDRDDIGTDLGWGIRRIPSDRGANQGRRKTPPLEPGPLRVLFIACSPSDPGFAELDYEREETAVLRAVGPSTRLKIGTLGTFEELQDLLNTFQPHVVHLSGHGMIGQEGASFVFEGESGRNDPRSAQQIAGILAGSGVRCAFISGCATGRAPPQRVLGGVCQNIVAHGVPLAIGWGASIVDDVSTQIAQAFYKSLAGNQPVDRAMATARLRGKWAGPRSDLSWSLPVLYAVSDEVRVLDSSAAAVGGRPEGQEQRPLPGMQDSYAPHLIGRRREMQQILPSLRDGQLQAIIITGLGGVGKSAFATRLARTLEIGAEKYRLIVQSCKPNEPLNLDNLIEACGNSFLINSERHAHALMIDNALTIEERLKALVGCLNDSRHVLVLDNFDCNMEFRAEKQRYFICDPLLSKFYEYLLQNLVGDSRVIITSRYLPADVDPLPSTVAELRLGELSETASRKFLFCDEELKRHYQAAAVKGIRDELLSYLYEVFGGSPSLMKQVRQHLKATDWQTLLTEIKSETDPAMHSDGKSLSGLEQKYTEYLQSINASRLYSNLSETSRRVLSHAAVYPGPMTRNAIAAITCSSVNQIEDYLEEWQRSATAYPEPEIIEAWSIYGSLRRWLTGHERLQSEERQRAQQAAADYLVSVQKEQREGELRLSRESCLRRARAQYLSAGVISKAREVTDRLTKFLIIRGEYIEVERLNREILLREKHPDPAGWIASAYLGLDEYGRAQHWYERALELAGDRYPTEEAEAIQGLAAVNYYKGKEHYTKAVEQLLRTLEIQERIDDRFGQGRTLHLLGSIDFAQEHYGEARIKFNKALLLLQGISEEEEPEVQDVVQAALHQLGSIELQEGHLSEARTTLEKAWAVARNNGNRQAAASAEHQLGRVDAREGMFDEALKKLKHAVELRRSMGDRAGEALSFRRLSELIAQRDPKLALRLSMVTYVIHKTLGHGDTDTDLEDVHRQATSLEFTSAEIEMLLADIEQQYLRERAKTLLEETFALRT
jgi:tetratricopeptide (TPR) repeat protein